MVSAHHHHAEYMEYYNYLGKGVSEWFKFNSLSRTADIKVHVVHITI